MSLLKSVLRPQMRFLTSEAYKVARGDYAKLNSKDLDFFKSVLEPKDVSTDLTELQASNVDWMQKYKGQSQLLLKPRTTNQVSEILKWCSFRKLAVVPQGGNTGLVGGSVPVFDEIVISMKNMNKILGLNELSGVVTCEAGVVLQTLDEYLKTKNFMFPIDLGAKGSCQIGGNVATNAGGLRLLRYGSLHGLVLGIEAVLPNGEIYSNMSTLRKDNTGLDLNQLFIGSEGSLGIITKVSVICPPMPKSVNVAWVSVPEFKQVEQCFKLVKSELNEILSSFECMDNESLDLVKVHTNEQPPIDTDCPFHILIETNGSNAEHDLEKLTGFLEKCLELEVIEDGCLAESNDQLAKLWTLRESISEVSGKFGGVYKYDVSLPLNKMWELVRAVDTRLSQLTSKQDSNCPVYASIGYGHIGDGNLHLNVAVRKYTKEVEQLLEPFVYEFVSKCGGSISAEHGLGFQKAKYVGYSKNQQSINMMKQLKLLYDPAGIMNPYKYIT